MAFAIDRSRLDSGTERWRILRDGNALGFAEVVHAWIGDAEFRASWTAGLRAVPFGAFCWECPPVTRSSSLLAFECVFVASPDLARMPPDPRAFAEHFRPDAGIATFANLGGDAMLVAPSPGPGASDYSQLARFVATAPASQQDALWQAVGVAMQHRIGARPTWLSTAGLGVAWLHVRLDSRPKYYRHVPYTTN